MNTLAMKATQPTDQEILGHLVFRVFSPLFSTVANDSVTVSIYSAFPESQFYLPKPTGLEAQGDPPVIPESNADADTKDAPVAEVTETKKESKPAPCRVIPGRTWESSVRTINELARRYIGLDPVLNRGTFYGDSAVLDDSWGMIENHPLSIFRMFYAGWAGTLNYRIYTLGRDTSLSNRNGVIPYVFYLPTSAKHAISDTADIPAHLINTADGFTAKAIGFPLATFQSTKFKSYRPLERLMPTNYDEYWTTVSAPFQTQFNFCYTLPMGTAHPGTAAGMLVVTGYESATTRSIIAMQCFGDDLRMGIYRPPSSVVYNPRQLSGGAIGVVARVGGFTCTI
jgi:hypothetical protein